MPSRTVISALVALTVVIGFAGLGAASGLGKYSDVNKAYEDGYGGPGQEVCVPNMGHHLLNFNLVDDHVQVGEPEALVYGNDSGELVYLGVEYLSTEEFSLFGHDAHFIPDVGLWGLHFWFYSQNDEGQYAVNHSDVENDAFCTYDPD